MMINYISIDGDKENIHVDCVLCEDCVHFVSHDRQYDTDLVLCKSEKKAIECDEGFSFKFKQQEFEEEGDIAILPSGFNGVDCGLYEEKQ